MTDFLIKLFVKNSDNTDNSKTREQIGNFAGISGICANLLLFIIKFIAGTISNSISITADAFNNLSDTGSSVITLIGFKLSSMPPDKEHPFGHGRIEYLTAAVVSAVIMFVGGELLITSVKKIFSPTPLNDGKITVTLIILIVSVALKLIMAVFFRKIGKKISSGTILATSLDSLTDCVATSAVFVSIIIYLIFNVNIDAYVGILVALFILYSGFNSLRETLNPLLGMPPNPETINEIMNTVLAFDGFLGVHDLIVHNYGPGRSYASLHVEVPEDVDIIKCHEQVDLCERLLFEKLNTDVVIHMDPINTNSEFVADLRGKITEKLSLFDSSLTFHDFRVVRGEKRTNIIFDVVIPSKYSLSEEQLKDKIQELVSEIDKNYICVIKIDRDYTSAL